MLSILLASCLLTAPDDLEGKVVRIAGGDTITVLVDRQQVRVRLSAIDAPEKGQDFYGNVELQVQRMKIPPFAEKAIRKELAQWLPTIGVSITDEALTRRPAFGLSVLLTPGHLDKLVGVFDWVLSEIKSAEQISLADLEDRCDLKSSLERQKGRSDWSDCLWRCAQACVLVTTPRRNK